MVREFCTGKMRRNKNKNGLLPSSLKIISSCLKTVTANAGNVASTVRSAGSSVSASISAPPDGEKDQVFLLKLLFFLLESGHGLDCVVGWSDVSILMFIVSVETLLLWIRIVISEFKWNFYRQNFFLNMLEIIMLKVRGGK